MKKQLLFATLLFSSSSIVYGQLDYFNEPAIGESRTMYEIDPATDAQAANAGTGVTWDFSGIAAVSATPRTIQVVDATGTTDASSYPSSVKAYDANSSLITYFNSSAASRISQGFVYNEVSIGTVMAIFSTDEQVLMTYPFNYGDNFTDNFAGSLSFNFNGPQNTTCSGVSHATIDGTGTLLLPLSTTVSNVFRLKLVDTVNTQVEVIPGIPMDIEFIRTQYEYYYLASGNLPLFTYANIKLQQVGATTPLQETNAIYSSVLPTAFAAINENQSASSVVYPNPSEGMITVNGNFSASASSTVYDQAGRLVHTVNGIQNGQTIDLSSLNKGTYLMVITDNGTSSAQSIVMK